MSKPSQKSSLPLRLKRKNYWYSPKDLFYISFVFYAERTALANYDDDILHQIREYLSL